LLDHELFEIATKIAIGDGRKASFWESSWIDGYRARDIAPLVYDICRKKKFTICKGMEQNFWVSQINTQGGLTVENIEQFAKLWE